jgi:thioredoxin-related protein
LGFQKSERVNFRRLETDGDPSFMDEAKRNDAMKALMDANLLSTQRLFIGKSQQDVAMLQLLDRGGQTRLVVMVDTDGTPQILFFDERGKLIHTLPK